MTTPPQAPSDQLEAISRAVRGRMPVLDGWRGLAILLVVLHNASYVVNRVGWLPSLVVHNLLDAGWVGVTLFFVLSGFLITGILLDTNGSPGYIRNFYIRRTLRIFPLYYAALSVAFLLPALVPIGWEPPPWHDQIWFWAYASNWRLGHADGSAGLSHFWSLAVEEQFYLVWPLLLVLAGRGRFAATAGLMVVGALAARLLLQVAGSPPEAIYQFTIARCDALAVGGLLAFAVRERSRWLVGLWPRRWAVLLSTMIALLVIGLTRKGLYSEDAVVQLVGQSLVVILFAGSMLATIAPERGGERRVARVLSARWLRFLGKYSYAIYVIHFPLHLALRAPAAGLIEQAEGWSRIALTLTYGALLLIASTLLSLASWHILEKRMLRLKDRLAPRAVAA